jgi:hypothetical protein
MSQWAVLLERQALSCLFAPLTFSVSGGRWSEGGAHFALPEGEASCIVANGAGTRKKRTHFFSDAQHR